MHRLCVRLLANIEETLSSPVFSQLVDRLGDTLDLLLGGDPVSIVKNETPLFHFCVFGLRIGAMNSALRRCSTIAWVGCPDASSC